VGKWIVRKKTPPEYGLSEGPISVACPVIASEKDEKGSSHSVPALLRVLSPEKPRSRRKKMPMLTGKKIVANGARRNGRGRIPSDVQ
jgi:hypothetical protein